MHKQKIFKKAVEDNNTNIVESLIHHQEVNPSDEKNYAIRFASEFGFFEIVKILLNDKRVDPSELDNWAIRRASIEEHFEIVILLLNHHWKTPPLKQQNMF